MPSIRVRKPFAATFVFLLLAAAYLGLSTQKIPQYGQSDKGLHFITFFLLTLSFYWIFETSRRRVVHLTLLICTAGLGIGSEIVQGLLPNGRDFDPFDILANVVGSALALLICSWYHRRMLERRRKSKHYEVVPGDDDNGAEGETGRERDVELGEGLRHSSNEQEAGSVRADMNGQTGAELSQGKVTNVTEELDNWDENEEDWEDGPAGENGRSEDPINSDEDVTESGKKRTD